MERSQILETMGGLKLFGMKAAYDGDRRDFRVWAGG